AHPDLHSFPTRRSSDLRTKADAESFRDLATYEAYTCLKPGSTLEKPEIDRDEAGRVRYAWKRGTPPVGPQQQANLVRSGKLKIRSEEHTSELQSRGHLV